MEPVLRQQYFISFLWSWMLLPAPRANCHSSFASSEGEVCLFVNSRCEINFLNIICPISVLSFQIKRLQGATLHGKVSRGYPRLFFSSLLWYIPYEMYPKLCYPPFVQVINLVPLFVVTK